MLHSHFLFFLKNHIPTVVISAIAGYAIRLFKDSLSEISKQLRRAISVAYARLGLYPQLLGRYKQSLLRTYSLIPLGYKECEIDVTKQYIKLKVNSGFVPPLQRNLDDSPGRTTSIEEILRDLNPSATGKPLRLAVLGQPGSGKTTLLKHLALSCANNDSFTSTRRMIPVFIPLRDLLGKDLQDFIVSTFEMHSFPVAGKFVLDKLQKGECILLLDGLDELLGEDQTRVANEIKRFSIVYDRNIFIVTSRIEGYVRVSEILFKEVEVAPLDPDGSETKSFVSGIIGADYRPEVFLETLRSDQNLRRLAESPLLLSLIVFIYTESGGNLPRNRTKIYRTAIQWMLRDRDKTKRIYEYRNKFDAEDKDLFLRKLAWSMFVEGSKDLSEAALIARITDLSQQLHLEPGTERAFLKEIAESNGILRRVFNERYGFLHPTFQEYYVAKEINEGNKLSEAYAHISDPAWSEIILFLSGLLDFQVAGKLIEDLVEKKEYAFAGRCLAHASTKIAGASEQIVPELIRLRSVGAQRSLIEIGDVVVITHLVDLFRDSILPDERIFAEECLSKLSQKTICEVVKKKIEMLRIDGHVRRIYIESCMLAQFRRLAGSGLDDSIERNNEAFVAAQRLAVARYSQYITGQPDLAHRAVGEYEDDSGLTSDLDAVLRSQPKLRDIWHTLTSLTNGKLQQDKEEKKGLDELRFRCGHLHEVCKELGVNVDPFRRKLSLICDIRAIDEPNDRVRWIARRNVVCV